MSGVAPASAWQARAGRWLLLVAVMGSALGLGAIHTPVLVVTALVAVASMALLWYGAEPLDPRPAATTLVLVAVGLTLWTTLQVVPLTRGLLAALAPDSADIWARCLLPLREDGPRWVTISLDPNATRLQVLRGVTYLTVFAAAIRVARRQEGVVFLERVLVASSVVLAAAALLHPALGARKVFGLYEPGESLGFDPHHLAPLLNLNHLAAYLNIGLLVAVQCVLERRDALPRPLALVVVLLLGATVVWTLSRGGTGAMVLGVLLVGLMAFAARRSRRSRILAPSAAFLAVVGGASLFFLALFDETRSKFARADLSKIDLVRTAFGLVREHTLFGVGRGAFESTFPKLRTFPEYWVNTHPEDVVAQWTTEWGVPVAVVGMVTIAWALRPRTALARSRVPAGAWAALAVVAAHNLVDFSSEVPGVVVALAVCAAIVTGGAGARTASPSASAARSSPGFDRIRRRALALGAAWWRPPLGVIGALSGALLVAILATLPFTGDELYNEQRSFRDLALDRSVSRETFRAEAKLAMLRHPAEPYFPFVGAVRAIVARDESVIPWAARALERSPVYGRVHLLVARSLYARNPSQARLEYRLACLQDSNLCMLEEVLPLIGGYDDAMELVVDGTRGLSTLRTIGPRLSARLPSTVVRLDEQLAARDPTDLGPVRRSAEAALQDVRLAEPWCGSAPSPSPAPTVRPGGGLVPIEANPCLAEGLAAARRLRAGAPDQCAGHALVAELRVAAGEVEAGFADLDGALDQVVDRSVCGRRLVSLAREIRSSSRLDGALERLLKLGCETAQDCIDNLIFAAAVETGRGRALRGLILTKKAWEREPEREDLLVEVATKAVAQGFHGEALDAYAKLAERHPGDRKLSDAVARERDAVARNLFQP